MSFFTWSTKALAIALVAVAAQVSSAGFEFQIRTFNASNTATTSFNLGDTVTVRILAADIAGPSPDFATDPLTGFTTKIFASTADPNDGVGSQTFNPNFSSGSGATGANFDVTGRTYGASGPGFIAPSPVELVSFNYVADLPGSTTFSFDPNLIQHTLTFANGPVDGYTPTSFSGQTVNVNIAAVPEPASLALIGLSAVGYASFRRRRARLATK